VRIRDPHFAGLLDDLASTGVGRRDGHAYRAPRPCGLTCHVGWGCDHFCAYCYVPELGLGGPPRPNPAPAGVFAVAVFRNPFFEPGRYGTFLAFGSVCDPFHPAVIHQTLSYLAQAARLGNPSQLATKIRPPKSVLNALRWLREEHQLQLNLLVSLTVLRPNVLEPYAPPPEERLQLVGELRDLGFMVDVFLRPLIPPLLNQHLEVVDAARAAGARGVVIGGLLINRNILYRLKRAGIDVSSIRDRVQHVTDKLRSVSVRREKLVLLRRVKEVGLTAFLTACCANASAAGVPCTGLCWHTAKFCTNCGNRCWEKLPSVSKELVADFIREIARLPVKDVSWNERRLRVRLQKHPSPLLSRVLKVRLQVRFRRRPLLLAG